MEYPIPELKQIADIFINKQLALEVQCSPISCELLRERSNGYRSLGIQVLWLLGEKLWLKERLTKLQRDFLYFSQVGYSNVGYFYKVFRKLCGKSPKAYRKQIEVTL